MFVRLSRNRKFANVVSLGTKLLFSSKREKRWREKSSAKSPGYNVFEKKMKRWSIVNRSVLKQRNVVRVWPSGLRRCSRKQKVEGSIPVRY